MLSVLFVAGLLALGIVPGTDGFSTHTVRMNEGTTMSQQTDSPPGQSMVWDAVTLTGGGLWSETASWSDCFVWPALSLLCKMTQIGPGFKWRHCWVRMGTLQW